MNTEDNLLSPGEAASQLHIHRETLRRYEDQGRIQSEKTSGGHRRFLQSEVDRFNAIENKEEYFKQKELNSLKPGDPISSEEISIVKEVFRDRFSYKIKDETVELTDPEIACQYPNLLSDTRLIGVSIPNIGYFIYSPTDKLVWQAELVVVHYDAIGRSNLVRTKKDFDSIVLAQQRDNALNKKWFYILGTPFFIFAIVFVGMMITYGIQWAGLVGLVFNLSLGSLFYKKAKDFDVK